MKSFALMCVLGLFACSEGATSRDLGTCDCAYLVGACDLPGASCRCWERGTMVCQANHTWELMLDVTGCPDTQDGRSYGGLGCLGGKPTCGGCTCESEVYVCDADGGTDGAVGCRAAQMVCASNGDCCSNSCNMTSNFCN